VYFANRHLNAMIDGNDPKLFVELFGDIGDQPVDLMLETSGGVTDSTEALVSFIRLKHKDIRVIVPFAAKSNGTLLCLAASEIVMSSSSQLGPIDPHLNINGGMPCTFLADPSQAAANPFLHYLAVCAIKQTCDLAEKLLSTGMMNGADINKIKEVVKSLSSREKYFSHGSVIDCEEALNLGLSVRREDPDSEFWKRIWLLHCMYDYDCQQNGYLKIFEGIIRSSALTPTVLPSPPQAKQN
jgi:hypothetical protein